jgi:hypothetical protein
MGQILQHQNYVTSIARVRQKQNIKIGQKKSSMTYSIIAKNARGPIWAFGPFTFKC